MWSFQKGDLSTADQVVKDASDLVATWKSSAVDSVGDWLPRYEDLLYRMKGAKIAMRMFTKNFPVSN